MLCPKCKTEMRLEASYRASGDESPDTPTQIYLVQKFFCRNKQCENFDTQVSEVSHKVN